MTQYLFSDRDLRDVLEQHRKRMLDTIDTTDVSMLASRSADEAVAAFVDEFTLTPPELVEGAVSVEVAEAQVDVSRDSMRHIRDRRRPFHIPGIRATYYVPFRGESNLLRCRPSRVTNVLPAVNEIRDGEIVLAFERPDADVASTKTAFDEELARLKQYTEWVHRDVGNFNASLAAAAQQRVAARRTRLEEMQKGAQSIGVPIRRGDESRSSPPTAHAVRRPINQPPARMYEVALSFAGEERTYVEEVAQRLKRAGVDVFYDSFERAELWGKNLVDHLADVYRNRAKFVVMFISEHYIQKAWTKHEREHAQARALVAKEEYILPVRFDDTELPGMTATVGHIDLRRTTPPELVELILTKLGRART